jgi:hypothetical protein
MESIFGELGHDNNEGGLTDSDAPTTCACIDATADDEIPEMQRPAVEFTLSAALEMLREKCMDYHKRYAAIFRSMEKDLGSPFVDYVEAIVNDPVEWLNSFPTKDTSEPALAKSKTAMLYLLAHEQVQAALGCDLCSSASDKLTAAWQANKKAILRARESLRKDRPAKARAAAELLDIVDIDPLCKIDNDDDDKDDGYGADGYASGNDDTERADASYPWHQSGDRSYDRRSYDDRRRTDDRRDDQKEYGEYVRLNCDQKEYELRCADYEAQLRHREHEMTFMMQKMGILKEMIVDLVSMSEPSERDDAQTQTQRRLADCFRILLTQW